MKMFTGRIIPDEFVLIIIASKDRVEGELEIAAGNRIAMQVEATDGLEISSIP